MNRAQSPHKKQTSSREIPDLGMAIPHRGSHRGSPYLFPRLSIPVVMHDYHPNPSTCSTSKSCPKGSENHILTSTVAINGQSMDGQNSSHPSLCLLERYRLLLKPNPSRLCVEAVVEILFLLSTKAVLHLFLVHTFPVLFELLWALGRNLPEPGVE